MTAVLFSWGKNMKTNQKKKNGATVQSLIGIKGFTEYGLLTTNGEMLFFTIIPTNISVLSYESVENKVRKLTLALSAVPDVEIACIDSAERFDDNKAYLEKRAERLETKNFFDCVLPGIVKFNVDHYIVGDGYRSAWAVREYPPLTEQQAIFARVADKNGVTLRIYHRLVESQEQRKIIQNATRKNKMKSGAEDNGGTDNPDTQKNRRGGVAEKERQEGNRWNYSRLPRAFNDAGGGGARDIFGQYGYKHGRRTDDCKGQAGNGRKTLRRDRTDDDGGGIRRNKNTGSLRPVSGRALKRKKFREPSQPKRASRREPWGGGIPMRVKGITERRRTPRLGMQSKCERKTIDTKKHKFSLLVCDIAGNERTT